MSALLSAYAPFQVVHCDWCDDYTTCRSLFQGDVWIMSICKECDIA